MGGRSGEERGVIRRGGSVNGFDQNMLYARAKFSNNKQKTLGNLYKMIFAKLEAILLQLMDINSSEISQTQEKMHIPIYICLLQAMMINNCE